MSNIKDIALAPSGELKIDWVKRNCPLLRTLEGEFAAEKPFAGLRIALSVHLEAKTAYLCRVLAAGGAEMYITGSNPLSTQDDVAAALVQGGLEVFAAYGCTEAEYEAATSAPCSRTTATSSSTTAAIWCTCSTRNCPKSCNTSSAAARKRRPASSA